MKILIVDDEFNARRVIRKMLSDQYENLNFLNDASSVEEAIELIRDEKPNIVFLDIQLGNKKSFDILQIGDIDIIFFISWSRCANN